MAQQGRGARRVSSGRRPERLRLAGLDQVFSSRKDQAAAAVQLILKPEQTIQVRVHREPRRQPQDSFPTVARSGDRPQRTIPRKIETILSDAPAGGARLNSRLIKTLTTTCARGTRGAVPRMAVLPEMW
ncbi:MAG: hypothetical protein CVU38_12180 [Chloroflexi bacterium HGW-Chloroflexi-1]|nr:MAG: hypothetical protein CVU38_12180 [Chloroflexi bacterium HGW-Chloroflexi-1]